tara:strand:+ start:792 stop:1013 length:222 start_codon:yes stop_codon:yes gene_type:complete
MRSSEDSAPKHTKQYLIAQDFVAHGIHYYVVEAETMGEAIQKIEDDPDLLPVKGETQIFKIMGYTEAEDNYDC